MQLTDIAKNTGITDSLGNINVDVTGVVSDSRQTRPGNLFVAVKGITTDGHRHISSAIQKGATAILCEVFPDEIKGEVCYLRVKNTAKALAVTAANYYGHPSKKINLVGITGTNGKTTVATMLYSVFTALGYRCGLISTINIRIAGEERDTCYTTPDALTTNMLLNEMVQEGCEYAFMEVSSHALSQSRTDALHFKGAVFTNVSHDHLDYHKSFRAYIKAKQLLFNMLHKEAFALTNLDDKNGSIVIQNTKAQKTTYSLQAMADIKGKLLDNSFGGLHLQIDNREVFSRLTGKFNAYNLLAVYGTGRLLGKSPDELLTAISNCPAPEGRFDHFTSAYNITGIVDYAHTPDALENVLRNINELKNHQQRLFTVIGCGGDRDKTKRPLMAAIAARYSDRVFFTSDNPRFENPDAIIREMIAGLDMHTGMDTKYIAINNRKEAIKAACITAAPGDIILVAGKGHEKYQEIRGQKLPFDDKSLLDELLNR